jgi:hypothetical protein
MHNPVVVIQSLHSKIKSISQWCSKILKSRAVATLGADMCFRGASLTIANACNTSGADTVALGHSL